MPGRSTIGVRKRELDGLFEALSLFDKIHEGTLSTVEKRDVRVPSKSVPGGWALILAHYNAAGAHACTTHQIIGPNGDVRHWDGADIYVGDVIIYKLPQRSQASEGLLALRWLRGVWQRLLRRL